MSCECTHCSSAATLDVIALAREAGAPVPPTQHRDHVRASLLAASRSVDVLEPSRRPPASRRFIVGAALAAVAAAAILALGVGRAPDRASSGHAHSAIRPLPGASYLVVSSAPDELVALYEGAIDVSVSPLHPTERFRVLVGGDEIEVHGTEFIATAHKGTLVDVRVVHGIVEVRSRSGSAAFLRAGETWRASELTQIARPAPQAALPAPVIVVRDPTPAVRPPARTPRVASRPSEPSPVAAPRAVDSLPHEAAYDQGWTAMREGRFAEAATSFLRVQLLEPDGALAEDATYWHAVALARGRSAQAPDAFREFLARYGTSRRAGEASAMLGWLLVEANQPAEAKRRFTAALSDASPAVQTSAQAGLDALGN